MSRSPEEKEKGKAIPREGSEQKQRRHRGKRAIRQRWLKHRGVGRQREDKKTGRAKSVPP